jgi:hypothetical protein
MTGDGSGRAAAGVLRLVVTLLPESRREWGRSMRTVALTGGTGYAPLRLALIAYVTLLVAIAWMGRLPSLAPADPGAGRVRAGGIALVSVFAAPSAPGV